MVILAAVTILFSMVKGSAVSALTLQLKEGVEEHRDKRIPFLTKKEGALPDYLLQYQIDNHWHNAGTKVNTSAVEPLTFELNTEPSFYLIQSIRVLDDDLSENDILEEFQLSGKEISGDTFTLGIETSLSFKAGLQWFASTALGKAIFLGTTIAVIFIIITRIGISF